MDQNSNKTRQTFWKQSDEESIVKFLSIVINGQKAYGKEYNIKDVFSYFKLKLASKYPAELVLSALDEYTNKSNDIPAPSDIINIIDPPKPEITQAEYVAAKDWQKRNDYPIFSEALDVIKAYEEQEKSKRTNFKSNNEKLNAIAKQTADMLSAK